MSSNGTNPASQLFLPGRWVSVQLQQPPAAGLAAATLAHRAGCKVVLDGAPDDDCRDALLAMADVLRADAREAGMLAGSAVSTAAEAEKAAAELLRQGPTLVALAVEGVGNLVAWPDGCVFLPLTETRWRIPPGLATRSWPAAPSRSACPAQAEASLSASSR